MLITEIFKIPHLTHLDISWNGLSEEKMFKILSSMRGHPNLTSIDLSHNNLQEERLAELNQIISSFPRLTHMELSGYGFKESASRVLVNMIEICPNLESIGLDRSHLNLGPRGFRLLAQDTIKLGRDIKITHRVRDSEVSILRQNIVSEEFEELKAARRQEVANPITIPEEAIALLEESVKDHLVL